MGKDWKLYVLHILDCIDKIRAISKRGNISEDFVLYDATLRNLQTLSESATHLPESFKASYSNIEWKAISGFRNILVHDYLGTIDPATIKKVINEPLPELENAVEQWLRDDTKATLLVPKFNRTLSKLYCCW